MFLADENENNDNESGGIYIYIFFSCGRNIALHLSYALLSIGRKGRRSG